MDVGDDAAFLELLVTDGITEVEGNLGHLNAEIEKKIEQNRLCDGECPIPRINDSLLLMDRSGLFYHIIITYKAIIIR